jgi:CRISPR-associated helicase Cas3
MTQDLRRQEQIQLDPVEFRYAQDQPDIPASVSLFPHQKQLFDALTASSRTQAKNIYVLTSMTGSGKTLANVLPAIATGKNAIFTYPTNALVKDQYRSITADKRTFGFDNRLTVRRLRSKDLRNQADDDIIPNALYHQFTQAQANTNEATIFLTTPDTLYNIVAGRYWSVDEFSEPMDRAQAAFAGCIDYVVFDEFHMYDIAGEVSMLNLATVLHHAQRESLRFPLVFSSATSEQQLETWLGEIARGNVEKFTDSAATVDDGDVQIAGGIELTLRFGPQWDGPTTFYETHGEQRLRNLTNSGPVTAIFESATRTLELVQKLQEETTLDGRIAFKTGPKSGGPGLTDPETAVQIGTRTLSVGIDFDTDYLFFESYRARDFLQKLGRVGRATDHASAIAYTSGYAFENIDRLESHYTNRRAFESDLLSLMFQRRRIRSYASAFGPLEFNWIQSNFPVSTAASAAPPWGVSSTSRVSDVAEKYARAFRNPGVPQVGIVDADSVRFQNLFDVLRLYELSPEDVITEETFLQRAGAIDTVAAQYVQRGTIRPVLFLAGGFDVSVSPDPKLTTERNRSPPTGLVRYTSDTVPRFEILCKNLSRDILKYLKKTLPNAEPLLYIIRESDFDSIQNALPHLFRTYEVQLVGSSYVVAFGQNALKLWSLDYQASDPTNTAGDA